MVYTTEELLELIDELKARGVTYFKVEGAEITMVPDQPHIDDDVEIEHTPGTPAEDLLYYSS